MGLLASCEKALQETPIPEEGVKTILSVGLVPETMTHMDAVVIEGKHKVYWSNGDKIAVNGIASNALSGLKDPYQQRASFTVEGVLTTPYSIVYPAGITTLAHSELVTLPAVQDYLANGFAEGMYPMAGYTADGSAITLKHLCSIVKVSVKRAVADADVDNLVSVRFKGRNNEQVSGSFSIDYENATLTGVSGNAADKVVKVVKSQETSTSQAAVYYIVVPSGTYSNGFDVIVQDANGHIMTKSKTSSKKLEAGHLYAMTEFDFVPTGTELGVEISNAQQLIAFANAYNNKEYAGLGDEPLIATLTNDIVFDATSSAEFNATGGIGFKKNLFGASDAEDYYFCGIFNGGGHTISRLTATVPIFAAINSDARVSNFTIADDCTFTFTHPNTTELDAGAAVGYNKGVLKDVDVEADVALAGGSVSQVTALGGLVGRVTVGTVDNCSYSGNLSVPDGFAVDAKKTYIGGLVGSMTNADGKVQNSDFEGTIDFAGTIASTDKNDPYLRLGGIVGTVNAGTVSNCEAKGTNTKEITMDNSTAYTATIQNHSRKAYHLAQGGIVGYNAGTVSSCTNGASVKNFVLANATKGGTSNDANSRYYDVGGIVGLNAEGATVTGCTNNGLFESRSTPRIQKIGGIVGYNKGTVSSSSNSASGDITIASATGQSPYSLRVGEVGGAVGNNGGTVSNIQNAGDITLSRTENNAGVEMKFGGVVGITTAAINGDVGKTISNSGNIDISYNPTTVTTDGLRLGGIVGSAQASVQNVSNTGNVTYTLSAANVMSKLYMGGIIGELNSAADVTVSGCENEGDVYFNVNSKAAAHTGNYLGGIIGLFTTTADVTATISGCDNSGYIHSACNGTTAVTDINVGGIVGYASGSSDVTISSCNNNYSAENEGKVHLLAGLNSDNNVGGILGYAATNVSISNSTNNGLVTYQLNTVLENAIVNGCVGGVMGTLASDKTASLTECTNNGEVFFDNNGKGGTKDTDTGKYSDTYSGGIVAKGAGLTLSECTNNGYVHGGNSIKHNGTTCYTGGIVAYLSGASSISDCTNTGNVYNDQFVNSSNTTNAFTGGIAAFVNGTDGSPITISGCEHNTVSFGSRRGYQGGIVGYANYVSISDSDNKASSLAGSVYYSGGIVGWMQNGSITNCDFTGSSIYSSQLQTNGGGGIAAKLDLTLVNGCRSSITDIYHTDSSNVKDADIAGGSIVGISGSGNTIQNCHYKDTINGSAASIAGTGSFTDGGGNAADL